MGQVKFGQVKSEQVKLGPPFLMFLKPSLISKVDQIYCLENDKSYLVFQLQTDFHLLLLSLIFGEFLLSLYGIPMDAAASAR